MPKDMPFLDQFAKLLDDAAGTAEGLRQDFEQVARSKLEKVAGELDMVPREEFEAVKALAVRARGDAALAESRIVKLESRLRRLEQSLITARRRSYPKPRPVRNRPKK